MSVSPVSKWMCCALLAVFVGGFGNRALGQGGGGDAPPLLDAKRMRLQPEEMVAPLKIFGDSFRQQDMTGVAAIHHALGEVDSRPGNIRLLIQVRDFINGSAVDAHTHRKLGMTLQRSG